ncbi:MAG: hypothetical protein NTX17_10510 [Candidatus Eisenbacteria bacterium]|nr:hypothetical protein [Candidatus Eisenbacteria bacterium]
MRKTILLACLFLILSSASRTNAGSAAGTPSKAEPPAPAPMATPSQHPGAALEILKAAIGEMQLQDSLLAGYRYLKTAVVEFLDDDLVTKKSEERLLEVTSIPHGPDAEVLIAVNGKRISEKERQKSEAEQKRRAQDGGAQLNLSSEDLVAQFDWSFAGTERVNGRPATILSFRPKPGAIYKGGDPRAEKFIRKVTGRVWVDDAERAMSRIEFSSTEPVKSFGGLFWTLDSLFVREERQRLPEGVWIDSTGEYFVDATALVVKRIVRRSTSHTHNYKRGPDGEPASGSGTKSTSRSGQG